MPFVILKHNGSNEIQYGVKKLPFGITCGTRDHNAGANRHHKTGSHNVHFCLPQTLDAIKKICPKRALLIGMTHEFDHKKDNIALMEWSQRCIMISLFNLRSPDYSFASFELQHSPSSDIKFLGSSFSFLEK
ncbi:hypothetical protein Sjap_002606 [Stephania japonica]|uniref:Uncharacterized protein n=1 Tax=Stephania japonica TaxID=461633 RepID=A0AAP0PW99_9MAGN